MFIPEEWETAIAVRSFVMEVEALANGEQGAPFTYGDKLADELELTTRELFEAHPITQVLTCLTHEGA